MLVWGIYGLEKRSGAAGIRPMTDITPHLDQGLAEASAADAPGPRAGRSPGFIAPWQGVRYLPCARRARTRRRAGAGRRFRRRRRARSRTLITWMPYIL